MAPLELSGGACSFGSCGIISCCEVDVAMRKKRIEPKLRLKTVPGPITLSEREEAFVQDYCKHGVGQRAAIAAGYAGASSPARATLLLRRPHVQARLAELGFERLTSRQKEAVRRETNAAVVILKHPGDSSVDWVIGELVKNMVQARAHKQYGPANQAIIKIGEHIGMWRDARKGDTDGRTPEELRIELAGFLGHLVRTGAIPLDARATQGRAEDGQEAQCEANG